MATIVYGNSIGNHYSSSNGIFWFGTGWNWLFSRNHLAISNYVLGTIMHQWLF